jgi:hypothetical protein
LRVDTGFVCINHEHKFIIEDVMFELLLFTKIQRRAIRKNRVSGRKV